MNAASYIFWGIFVVPLVIFLIWLMKQDKRKGTIGIFVVIAILVAVIVYMYFKDQFVIPGQV